jgi:hypothetical protein
MKTAWLDSDPLLQFTRGSACTDSGSGKEKSGARRVRWSSQELEMGTRGGEWRGGEELGHGTTWDKNATRTWLLPKILAVGTVGSWGPAGTGVTVAVAHQQVWRFSRGPRATSSWRGFGPLRARAWYCSTGSGPKQIFERISTNQADPSLQNKERGTSQATKFSKLGTVEDKLKTNKFSFGKKSKFQTEFELKIQERKQI